MTVKSNTLESGTDETVISNANSASPDAFETAVIVGSPVFDTAQAAHGTKSMRSVVSASSTCHVGWTTTGNIWYIRAYVRLDVAPPASLTVFQITSGATIRIALRILTGRTVQVASSALANLGTSATVLALNTWYRLEFRVEVGTTLTGLGVCRIYSSMDSTTITETVTATSTTVGAWDRIRIGSMYSAAQTHSYWLDDIKISDVGWTGPAPTIVALGVNTETDAAQALTRRHVRVLGINTSTETAVPIGRKKIRSTGIVLETNSAQPLTRLKTKTLGVTTESNTAQPASRVKLRALGVNTESDLSVPIVRGGTSVPVTPATSTEIAMPIGRRKVRVVGIVTEADTPIAVARVKQKSLTVTTEVDLATSVVRQKSKLLGIVTESNVAQSLGRLKRRLLGILLETDSTQLLERRKTRALGIVPETDLAVPSGRVHARSIAPAVESDVVVLLGRKKLRTAGVTTEDDLAVPVTTTMPFVYGPDVVIRTGQSPITVYTPQETSTVRTATTSVVVSTGARTIVVRTP